MEDSAMTAIGLTGAISISPYSPINSTSASGDTPCIARNGLVRGRGTHQDCRPANDCAAHARASPRQGGSSRAFLSCPWTEAWTKPARCYPVVEAGSPAQSTRPCSAAANQRDPGAAGIQRLRPTAKSYGRGGQLRNQTTYSEACWLI